MRYPALGLRRLACVTSFALLAFSTWAYADPPSRIARLGYMSGPVSFSPAGQNDWDQATLNRPLTTGDRLWSDAGARAEIQVGGAMVRMQANTGVSVLNLDDRIAQLQLTQGSLNVRVRRLEPNQVFEVATPNLAFTLRQPGEYRIEVDPDGSATTIIVRNGQGEAYGDGASYVIDSRQPYRFTGTGLRDYEQVAAPRFDDFDRWSRERDRSYDTSVSARYVSPNVIGAQDLDAYGSWRVDASYGNVWVPNRVAMGWAPYRDGHWAWVAPWGWTWVDDAPWGFAVSHYGRWANLGGTWGWVPGPVRMQAVYAPALVVFVGGSNFQLSISSGPIGGVAWFPLAPREVYRPSYAVSRDYYERINRSNTVVNNTVIQNTYNTTNVTNIVYANRMVPGAVVAVPTTTFVQSQPVSRAAVRVSTQTLQSAPVTAITHVAPTEQSVRGAAARGDKPPARVFERPVIAHTAPPAPPTAVAVQPPAPSTLPGRAGENAQRQAAKPAAAAPPPTVRVVEQGQAAPPTRKPPPPDAAPRQADARDDAKDRGAGPAPTGLATPSAATPVAAPSPVPAQTAPPVAAGRSPEPRARDGASDKEDKRPPESARAAERAPEATTPVARPQEPRGKSENQGKAAPQRDPQAAGPAPAPAPAPPTKPVILATPAPAAITKAAPPMPQPPIPVPVKPTSPTPPDAAPAPQRGKPDAAQSARPSEPRPAAAASRAQTPSNPSTAQAPAPVAEPKPTRSGKPTDKDARDENAKRDKNQGQPKE